MISKKDILPLLFFYAFLLCLTFICIQRYDFHSPSWLLTLITLPLISLFFIKKKNEIFGELVINEVSKISSSVFYHILTSSYKYLTITALFFMILSLARPQEDMVPKDISKEGIDVIIALDVSLSMLAKDFEPDRLAAAKRVAKEFVKDRQNDRIGIVIYAAESYPKVPLTSDNQTIINAIDEIEYGELKDGTAIGMGLASAVNRLKESESKSQAVILLSDGENNQGEIRPEVASELAKAYGVRVYTIGVGSEGTAISPGRDLFGNIKYREVQVRIDERTLFEIAEKTGGKYFRATSEEKLKEIYSEIDKLEKTRFEATIIKQKADVFYKFLSISLVLMVIVFLLRNIFFKSIFS